MIRIMLQSYIFCDCTIIYIFAIVRINKSGMAVRKILQGTKVARKLFEVTDESEFKIKVAARLFAVILFYLKYIYIGN